MAVLVIAEHDNATLNPATLNSLSAASAIDGEIAVLVAGQACRGVAEQVAGVAGISRVMLVDDAAYARGLAENLAPLIAGIAAGFSHVLASASSFGKNLMPRVGALLDMQPITDVVAVVAADTFVRPIYAGNAMATVRSSDAIKIITARGTAFPPAAIGAAKAAIATLPAKGDAGLSRFLRQELTKSERPELTQARIVVSGGRGMGSGENFRLIEALADRLGAAVGASRAAVDAGYAANDRQVGQTGKVVAPDLYIAVGISGAIQHLSGMKDSKVIVAINKDEEAPIFQVADYGLVGDLFKIVPELTTALPAKG